jgi:hypothetical protein
MHFSIDALPQSTAPINAKSFDGSIEHLSPAAKGTYIILPP